MNTPTIVAISFGIIFIIVILLLSIKFPNPTPHQAWVFRVVLSLAAAGIGATLPGLLKIEGQIAQFAIGASGALGLFIIVYFFNPPKIFHNTGIIKIASKK